MKKLALLMMVMGVLMGQSARAVVVSTTYAPNPSDLQDLDHSYYYSWAIATNIADPTTIVGAQLRIDNINDWAVESNDHLYVRMFDEAPTLGTRLSSNVTRGTDYQGSGDAFAGQGAPLLDYSDTNDYTDWVLRYGWWWPVTVNPDEDLVYDFTARDLSTLAMFLQNGSFGLTFDPDCHYCNSGISLVLYTEDHPDTPPPAVPEPATGLLALLGVGGMAGLRRLRRRAA